MKTTKKEDYVTIKMLAEKFGVHTKTISEYSRAHFPHKHKGTGHQVFYTKDESKELCKFIKSGFKNDNFELSIVGVSNRLELPIDRVLKKAKIMFAERFIAGNNAINLTIEEARRLIIAMEFDGPAFYKEKYTPKDIAKICISTQDEVNRHAKKLFGHEKTRYARWDFNEKEARILVQSVLFANDGKGYGDYKFRFNQLLSLTKNLIDRVEVLESEILDLKSSKKKK